MHLKSFKRSLLSTYLRLILITICITLINKYIKEDIGYKIMNGHFLINYELPFLIGLCMSSLMPKPNWLKCINISVLDALDSDKLLKYMLGLMGIIIGSNLTAHNVSTYTIIITILIGSVILSLFVNSIKIAEITTSDAIMFRDKCFITDMLLCSVLTPLVLLVYGESNILLLGFIGISVILLYVTAWIRVKYKLTYTLYNQFYILFILAVIVTNLTSTSILITEQLPVINMVMLLAGISVGTYLKIVRFSE